MFSRSPHREETKRKWQESTGCFLIVSDCLVYFPRPWPPINPAIYVRLGQSQSCVAMVRDCLHPVMLHSHVGSHADTHTHTLQHALLSVHHLFQWTPLLLPQPPCCFKNWPLIASSSVVEKLFAVALKHHIFRILCHFNHIFRRVTKIFHKCKKYSLTVQ